MSFSEETLKFLENKWRAWFKSLDFNGDGVLTRQDYKESETDFENFYKNKVDDKTLQEIREGFRVFWEDFIFRRIAHKDSIKEDEFVAHLLEEFQTDPDEFRNFAHRMFNAIIRSADTDHNKYISYDEFKILFHAFGHKNEEVTKTLYEDYGPTKQGIGIAQFADSWIDVAIGLEPGTMNIPYKGFMSNLKNFFTE